MATTEQAQTQIVDDAVLVPTSQESIVVEAPHKAAELQPDQTPDYTKTIDKMGNELGELRKQNKELMAQLQAMQVPQVPEQDPVSFADDPESFIQQSIEAALQSQLGPKLQVLESDLLQRKNQQFDAALAEIYPDWKETANTDSFAEWIKASPARVQMYQLADANYDVESAAELLKRYKQDSAERKESEQGAIAAAGLVTGGGETGGARVYAASEIKNMITTDPEGYRRWLSTEGMQAYQEGRVDQNR